MFQMNIGLPDMLQLRNKQEGQTLSQMSQQNPDPDSIIKNNNFYYNCY